MSMPAQDLGVASCNESLIGLVKLTRPTPQYLSTRVHGVQIFYELVVFLLYTLL